MILSGALPALILFGVGARDAHAQGTAKFARIAYLGMGSAERYGFLVEAVKLRLGELGYVEGKSALFDVRWADGKVDRVPAIAKELIALRPDVIIAMNTYVARALKQATVRIPIVFGLISDPVGAGLVPTLSHPGGNVTGTSTLQADFAPKVLELLFEVVPKHSRIAILYALDSGARRSAQTAAQAMKADFTMVDVGSAGAIDQVFSRLSQDRVKAVVGLSSGVSFFLKRREIAEAALKHRMPSIFMNEEDVAAGVLMSYGPSFSAAARAAADYVDKVLKGAKPADLPVEQIRKIDLVVNMKTAKALGLNLPGSILVRADRVIE